MNKKTIQNNTCNHTIHTPPNHNIQHTNTQVKNKYYVIRENKYIYMKHKHTQNKRKTK